MVDPDVVRGLEGDGIAVRIGDAESPDDDVAHILSFESDAVE